MCLSINPIPHSTGTGTCHTCLPACLPCLPATCHACCTAFPQRQLDSACPTTMPHLPFATTFCPMPVLPACLPSTAPLLHLPCCHYTLLHYHCSWCFWTDGSYVLFGWVGTVSCCPCLIALFLSFFSHLYAICVHKHSKTFFFHVLTFCSCTHENNPNAFIVIALTNVDGGERDEKNMYHIRQEKSDGGHMNNHHHVSNNNNNNMKDRYGGVMVGMASYAVA